ncbi:hypothetical protein GAYE_SCF03G2245 [Galdieria yellowstonensis]|uniref:Transmembrane protein 208 n=1 Tax=Galdieria yellowstonensis TaxID=3028027 RepID=A0AAV9IAC3_9RHOD|nr:hypothetical protein GAYE_SCF03G2245 [Galdieria yellowstonensis]
MAQNAARNTLKSNRIRLRYLRNLILGSNFSYVVVRIFLARHSFTVAQFLLWLISLILVACSYFFLHDAAKPTFERGVLVDGGYDISSKGWMEYCHDIIYICCFTVVCAIFSNKFWFTLLLIPTYALYSIICLLISPSNPTGSKKSTKDSRRRQ